MPLDVNNTLQSQAWSLLTASAGFTSVVAVGNRIDDRTLQSVPQSITGQTPADFRGKGRVEISVSGSTIARTAPKTFGQRQGGAAVCDYCVPITCRLTVTARAIKAGDISALKTAIIAAMFSQGRTMGLGWVSEITVDERNSKGIAQAGPTDDIEMVFNVDARPLLSALTN